MSAIANSIFRDSSGSPGTPPCQRCIRDRRECVLGSSNRGGRRIRKNRLSNGSVLEPATSPLKSVQSSAGLSGSQADHVTPTRPYSSPEALRRPDDAMDVADDETASTVDSNIASAVPQNPSDAWQFLAHVAKRGDNPDQEASTGPFQQRTGSLAQANGNRNGSGYRPDIGIMSYRLVREGPLNPEIVSQLIARYAEHFHAYLPLVPRKYFDPAALDSFASGEKHLLTAILTIASKDLVDMPHVHEHCSKYMHELISGIAAGTDCDVEAVEALLLLAEWEPQGLRTRIEAVGRGEEDRAAWMHVGLALRSGYFLGLDRTSFRNNTTEDAKSEGRKRLAWASCYISDRLISVRIGRAFWSRGPGPMTGLSSQDFPSLQPLSSGEEDYARIFQATLDLTQLYSNVHDVLYSGMRTSGQMMLMGDYVKYVDDFRAAISRWNRIWGTLTCKSRRRLSTLDLSS